MGAGRAEGPVRSLGLAGDRGARGHLVGFGRQRKYEIGFGRGSRDWGERFGGRVGSRPSRAHESHESALCGRGPLAVTEVGGILNAPTLEKLKQAGSPARCPIVAALVTPIFWPQSVSVRVRQAPEGRQSVAAPRRRRQGLFFGRLPNRPAAGIGYDPGPSCRPLSLEMFWLNVVVPVSSIKSDIKSSTCSWQDLRHPPPSPGFH